MVFVMRWALFLISGLVLAEDFSAPPLDLPTKKLDRWIKKKHDPEVFISPKSHVLSCKDVLLDPYVASVDSDVNLVYQHVSTLCTMELAMQKYLEYAQKRQKGESPTEVSVKKNLASLQKILGPMLNAYVVVREMFEKKGLREELNDQQQGFASTRQNNNTLD